MTLLLSVGLLLTLGTAPSLAQEKLKVAGTLSMTEVRMDTMAIGNVEGHFLALMRSTGTNAATGGTKFMDGAQAVNSSASDLVNGNGMHHGYLILTQGANSVFCKWSGNVTTVQGTEGPRTTFEGTFTWIGGTGEYAKIGGSGTYRGHYTSKIAYTAEWAGEYSVGK